MKRGVTIEITYGTGCLELGDAASRKQFLMNAMDMVRLTKGGRNLILASEAASIMFMRSPTDVHLLAKLIGVRDQESCHATVQQNCAKVFQHAHHRKTFKGVAELVEVSSSDS